MIAIIGGVIKFHNDIPFDSSDCEIWTIGRCSTWFPRVDRIYELHGKEYEEKVLQSVKEQNNVLYTWKNLPTLPDGPIENSVAVMLAHIVSENRKDRIGIWGAPHKGSHIQSKPSVLYWIGYLRAIGVEVEDHSDLINKNIYMLRG